MEHAQMPDETRRGALSKERLLAAATRFISRNGAQGTTLAKIAQAAGVSQAGLIYHFATKDDLINAVLDRHEEDDRYAVLDQCSSVEELLGACVAAVARWQEQPETVGMHSVVVAENVGLPGPIHDRLARRYWRNVERVFGVIEDDQRRGTIRSDVSPRGKAIEIVAFIDGLETAWMLDPTVPAAEVAERWARDQIRAMRTR